MAITYTEVFDSFTPGTEDTWTDYDIYTNDSIPLGAVVEILICNAAADVKQDVGVRTDGSAIDRRTAQASGSLYLSEAENGGETSIRMFVTVHAATGLIEYYVNNTANITFRIVGYFEGVTFTETAFTEIGAATYDSWTDWDLNGTNGVPNGDIAHFAVANFRSFEGRLTGVRTDGSSLNRYTIINEAENGHEVISLFAVCHASTGLVEYYRDASQSHIFLTGYFDSTDMGFVELYQNLNVTSASSWEDFDLSAYLDEDGRVVDVLLMHQVRAAAAQFGVRENGGAEPSRIVDIAESEDNGYRAVSMTVQTDAGGIIELYGEDTSGDAVQLTGYFTWEEEAVGGNIKTVNGIAWANVKSVNGVVKANIKSINGVSAS